MKTAIIGSRELIVKNLSPYISKHTTEIVSGGAKGIDNCAKNYAIAHNIKLTEFLPQYEKYGRYAPLQRNLEIIDYSDEVIAFWNGKSKGTEFVIENCKKKKIRITVVNL